MKKKTWTLALALGVMALAACNDTNKVATASLSPQDEEQALKAIETDIETCSHFLGEEPYDLERAISLYQEADKSCGDAKKKINDLFSKVENKADIEGKVNLIFDKYLSGSIDESIKNIKSMRKFYEGEEGKKFFADKELKENDPFPYTAVITCGMNGFDNINLLACLGGDVGTEIEINNGGDYGMYKVYNLPSDWQTTSRGVEIPLARNFSIKMQNSNENLIIVTMYFFRNRYLILV